MTNLERIVAAYEAMDDLARLNTLTFALMQARTHPAPRRPLLRLLPGCISPQEVIAVHDKVAPVAHIKLVKSRE